MLPLFLLLSITLIYTIFNKVIHYVKSKRSKRKYIINRIITPGYEDNNIIDYWKNTYSAVFIAFKPFYKLIKRKDYTMPYGQYETLNVKIKKKYRPVKWKIIKKFKDFKSYEDIQKSLTYGNLNKNNEEKLNDLFENYNVIPPYEDFFYPFQVKKLLEVMLYLGYDQVRFNFVIPELFPSESFFLDRTNIENIDAIIKGGYSNMYTEDNKILIANLPNQHVTLICSDRETVKLFVQKMDLEGFYASGKTNFHWHEQT
ncbi:DUF2711 family protein [Pedobacter nototheniae]|uniref:DUF2711 family protein n=1 Tax=Pedobacter nototheniae TaxID=2488994 RepID=UPI00292F35D8|nr:DUF2711 family protein [Pedobacter nototheniae]